MGPAEAGLRNWMPLAEEEGVGGYSFLAGMGMSMQFALAQKSVGGGAEGCLGSGSARSTGG